MAERRMFTQKITQSDAFIEMPMSSQALYFHLCMNADDDGFVKNPKSIQRLVGCNDDDLKLLIAKRFIIPFETGVIVIKHWRMHNLLRKDRYKETVYTEEKAMLFLKNDGAYTLDESQGRPIPKIEPTVESSDENSSDNQAATDWQPNGNQMAPQDRLGKDRVSNKNESKKESRKESREIYINNKSSSAGAREGGGNPPETYDSIMERYGIKGKVREATIEFNEIATTLGFAEQMTKLSGEERKAFAQNAIMQYCENKSINFTDDQIDAAIERLIALTKKVNAREKDLIAGGGDASVEADEEPKNEEII